MYTALRKILAEENLIAASPSFYWVTDPNGVHHYAKVSVKGVPPFVVLGFAKHPLSGALSWEKISSNSTEARANQQAQRSLKSGVYLKTLVLPSETGTELPPGRQRLYIA